MKYFNVIKYHLVIILLFNVMSGPKLFGQIIQGEWFNTCSTSGLINCGNNTYNYPLVPGSAPPIPGSGGQIVRYYMNVTSPITATLFFSGLNMQPYSVIISTPLNTTLSNYCSTIPGTPPSVLYNFSSSGTGPYTTPPTTFAPGLYVVYARYNYSGSPQPQPFYTFYVNMNCESIITPVCPTVSGVSYQTYPCNPSFAGCNGKCKYISGNVVMNQGTSAGNYTATINFGDGSAPQSYMPNSNGNIPFLHAYNGGTYTVTTTINGPGSCVSTYTFVAYIVCLPPPCSDCVTSFAPTPGSDYIISAWVKESNALPSVTSYTNAKLKVSFLTAPTSQPNSNPVGTPFTFSPTGLIIDGWQKIEEKFTIPGGAGALKIDLISGTQSAANFDDIRVFPVNGSMKGYVYDPLTMRLMAELDERNYATFYEYDEEGKLIRVKKETEKGVMTIKESRNNAPVK